MSEYEKVFMGFDELPDGSFAINNGQLYETMVVRPNQVNSLGEIGLQEIATVKPRTAKHRDLLSDKQLELEEEFEVDDEQSGETGGREAIEDAMDDEQDEDEEEEEEVDPDKLSYFIDWDSVGAPVEYIDTERRPTPSVAELRSFKNGEKIYTKFNEVELDSFMKVLKLRPKTAWNDFTQFNNQRGFRAFEDRA